MPNTIRIKRRMTGAIGAPGSLRNAEIAFNEVDKVLYYGLGYDDVTGYSDSIISIGGSGYFTTLNTDQTLTGVKTFNANVFINQTATINTLDVYSGDLTSNSSFVNLFLTSNTISIGANTSTTTINDDLIVKGDYEVYGNTSVGGDFEISGDLAINGGDLTTLETVFNILASPEEIYFGANASIVEVGSTNGSTTIKNNLIIDGDTTTVHSSNTILDGEIRVANNAYVGGDLHVTGNLGVDGTFTTINSTTVTVDDKNIELGSTETPTNITADGGGVTLKGDTDKTIIWDLTNNNWTSSENWNLASGKTFKINNVNVLSSDTLGSGVVNSSLTSVGTITTGVWKATTLTANNGGTGFDSYAVGDILYADSTGTLAKLPLGTGDQILTVNSSGTGLEYKSIIDCGDF